MSPPIHRSILELVVLTLSLSGCYASVLQFQRIIKPGPRRRQLEGLSISDVLGTSGPGKGDNSIKNHEDIRYSTNITLGEYVVALDTGSTDMWVHPIGREAVGEFNDTGMDLGLYYGDGSYGVQGTIATAAFHMGSFNVSQQAFLHVQIGNVGALYELGLDGVLGLGHNVLSASPLAAAVRAMHGPNATWGAPLLKNIFDQNPSRPNFIAIDLAREYDEKWASVADAPKLELYPKGTDRWTTILQGIYVDGTAVNLTGGTGGVPGGGIPTLLDTGAPTGILPEKVRDRIYGSIPGALSFVQGRVRYWLVPCNATAVVEFEFGGQRFPMHPLDLSGVTGYTSKGGKEYTACVGTISGINDVGADEFGAILGDEFLRNVYSVYDFGDSQTNGTTGEPYMQLLAQTNSTLAASQVAEYRNRTMADLPPEISPADLLELLKQEDPTVSTPDPDLLNCGSACEPPPNRRSLSSTLEKRDGSSEQIAADGVKRDPLMVALLVLNLAVGIAVLAFAVLNFVRNGRLVRRPTRAGPHYVSVSAAARSTHLDSASMYAGSTQGGPFRGHYEDLDGHSRSPSVTSNLVV
ncbi:hypothetical protein NMY22_g9597 [Coprinellus aureogranulatus]|nr:hypothetical protein NMY22_g9597 [Coprinellus aureogranulatus]